MQCQFRESITASFLMLVHFLPWLLQLVNSPHSNPYSFGWMNQTQHISTNNPFSVSHALRYLTFSPTAQINSLGENFLLFLSKATGESQLNNKNSYEESTQ